MNLAKWLTLNGSLKHIGGESKFTLPSVNRGRYELNSLKVKNEDVLTSDEKSTDKQEIFRANELKNSYKMPCPPEEKDKGEISFNNTVSLNPIPAKKVLETDSEEGQLTLDGWKERSVAPNYSSRSNSRISYHSVGRWALKRLTKRKLPKPPPVQRQFRFKAVKVVRNELQYSDIEVIAKPGNRLFDKMASCVCSLISWIYRVLKIKRI